MKTAVQRPNIIAASLAIGIVASVLGMGIWWQNRQEANAIHVLATRMFPVKDQGVVLQRTAFAEPDLLPVYGSSELNKNVPDQANVFFAGYPTGFNVFPVGKAGSTPLIMLQKLAAVGPAVRGKKLVICLSPSWFYRGGFNEEHYAGNFSHLQAEALVLNSRLDPVLKKELAATLLEHAGPLEKHPALKFLLQRQAAGGWSDRAIFKLAKPLGEMQLEIGLAQDHFGVFRYLFQHKVPAASVAHGSEKIDWHEWLVKESPANLDASGNTEGGDSLGSEEQVRFSNFTVGATQGPEWNHLVLLLRVLHELRAKPLIISIPMNGPYLDSVGVKRSERDVYYSHLQKLAAEFKVPVIDFHDCEDKPGLLVDGYHDHLSPEGWIYVNHILDDFYHGRPLSALNVK